MEVGVDRRPGERLKRRLGAKHPRRPIGLRIHPPEHPERRAPDGDRQRAAQASPPSHATDTADSPRNSRHRRPPTDATVTCLRASWHTRYVGNRRAVGVRLVVGLRENVDQVEIVAFDGFDKVSSVIPVRHLAGEHRLVERRIAERDRARVDRSRADTCHHRDNRAGVHAAGQEGAERYLGDHPQADGLAQAVDEFGFCVALADRIVQREPDIPIFTRLRHRVAASDRQRMRRRKLEGACVDRARLGNVAQGEILLDRKRIEIALEIRDARRAT